MIVAWAALLIWPLLMAVFFATLSIPTALVLSVVGGYLFLPEQVEFDLPVLPKIDKTTLPVLSALLFAAIAAGKQPGTFLKGYIPRNRIVLGLLVMLFLGVAGTVLTNGDPVLLQERWRPVRVLPGLRTWDLMASTLVMLMMLLPFLLGRKYLATEEAQRKGLMVFVALAFGYSFLALIEIRLSPQLNVWIYGFFPHSFAQHIRGGGFRPLVFLNHGLWLAIFFTTAILAAAGLARCLSDSKQRMLFMLAAFWILATLVLSRSLGALVLAILFLGLMVQPQKLVRYGLLFFVCTVIFYPLLRSTGLIPTDFLLNMANQINPERARSLGFRLSNEQLILDHTMRRPLFGWGGWERNLAVIMENGKRVVPDGRWTIIFGQGGYMRFLAEFGLLCAGILGVIFSRRPVAFVSVIIAVMLTANLVDLLPNGTQTPLTWLWAGALAGRLELKSEGSASANTPVAESRPERNRRPSAPVYARSLGERPAYRRNFKQTDPSS